ncbi:hypothetical protein ACU6VI_18285 (plasmid) [Sphaerotilus natans]|uniref:hypothetical protein n=1 Tax=Sphaerotilus natans TaxID=34103 RepID=UPI00406CA108
MNPPTLNALDVAWKSTADELQNSAGTCRIKGLQMVQLQKAISAVGMFAMFDAEIQKRLQCKDGFAEANQRLAAAGNAELRDLFFRLQQAVNVLKHGRGRSYDALVAVADKLPFRVKLPDEDFFNEGDVSEISTMIEVNDAFVQLCVDVINQVTTALNLRNQYCA